MAFAAVALAGSAAQASLPDLIASTKPSVVAVGTYNPTDNPRFGFRGTGFVVGDGTQVITNFHVLPGAVESVSGPTLMIQIPKGGRELEGSVARLISSDRTHDLALLQIEGPPLPALPLEGSGVAREGTSIALIGFPIGGVLGFAPVTHRGIIASISAIALPAPTSERLSARAIATLRDGAFDILQLDATAYPGNSGGPVLDVQTGRVVGVVNMVLIRGTRESALSHPTGITYAIPVRFVTELLKGGR
ncbi:MAG: serine protease [Rubrivivax sp.]|nr:serine protease [Rubrivivax sp.]